MYKIGQKLVCVNDNWLGKDGTLPQAEPKKGEIVTFEGVNPDTLGFIALKEYPGPVDDPSYWDYRGFMPLLDNDVKESFPRQIVETIDVPQIVPEHV